MTLWPHTRMKADSYGCMNAKANELRKPELMQPSTNERMDAQVATRIHEQDHARRTV